MPILGNDSVFPFIMLHKCPWCFTKMTYLFTAINTLCTCQI